jgi:hypothetical protein
MKEYILLAKVCSGCAWNRCQQTLTKEWHMGLLLDVKWGSTFKCSSRHVPATKSYIKLNIRWNEVCAPCDWTMHVTCLF